MSPCKHCLRRAAQPGRRGLCCPCWRDLDVRGRYEPENARGNRFPYPDLPEDADAPLPHRPLRGGPGDPARIGALAARAKRGLSLFLPRERPARDEDLLPGLALLFAGGAGGGAA